MDIEAYQKWISDFYRKRNWYQYDVFIRSNFLIEEVGELAQAIRKREIGRDRPDELFQSDVENLEDIKEELGDVLDNIFILADKYGISLEEIAQTHQEKLERRFAEWRLRFFVGQVWEIILYMQRNQWNWRIGWLLSNMIWSLVVEK